MNKFSIKPFLIECGVILEASTKWTSKVKKNNISDDVYEYASDVYFSGFQGEANVKEVNLILATWLITQINSLGGPQEIGTKEREKLITIVSYAKFLEDNNENPNSFLKNNLDETYEFAKEKLEEEKEKQDRGTDIEEAPITKVEQEGLVNRIYSIPDGSGRVWVKVNQEVAGKFFDTRCDLGRPYGVGCQSKLHGVTLDDYRKPGAISYSLLGPKKGTKIPVSTLVAISVQRSSGTMTEARQAENKVIGSEAFYGWNDYADQFVIFLGTAEAKKHIKRIERSAASFFQWIFHNKKFNIINHLNLLRPDLIENSADQIKSYGGQLAIEWFETKSLNAIDALKRFGPEGFIQRIDDYSKSETFKEALAELSPSLPEISKKNPNLILSKVSFLLDFLPLDDFKTIISNIDFADYIRTHKNEFHSILKKLTNVNSKEAKGYKDIFKTIISNFFPVMVESFGVGLSGVRRLIDFLEMPKSDKHKFIKRTPDGKIIALKKDVTVNPDTHERTETDVEFELADQLSILPQKERREMIKKNEDFIKNLIEGDDEKKEINFLRILFGATNPQDIQRTLIVDKEKFINYYDKFNKNETARIIAKLKEIKDNNPDFERNNTLRNQAKKLVDIAKSLTLNGIPKPGIMTYYSLFNKGQNPSTAFYKFTLEDLRNPKVFSELKNFYEKVETKKGKKSDQNIITIKLNVAEDMLHLFKLAGASNEEIYQVLSSEFDLSSIVGGNIISPNIYSNYYDILAMFTSKQFAKQQIEKNKDNIIAKSSGSDYRIILSKFSITEYNVKPGDMVEFLGKERADIEKRPEYINDTNNYVSLLRKYYYLDTGRRYKVTQVDGTEKNENGEDVINTKIKVIDNTGKETEWLNSKEFKITKNVLNEEDIIRKTIAKKLLETYLKNKK